MNKYNGLLSSVAHKLSYLQKEHEKQRTNGKLVWCIVSVE